MEGTGGQRIAGFVVGAGILTLLAVLAFNFNSRIAEPNVEAANADIPGESAQSVAPSTSIQPLATTSNPPSTAPTSAPTTTVPLREASLAFTGDILAHTGVVAQAGANARNGDAPVGADFDFAPMFELVEPYLAQVDAAICHLETPLSPNNDDLQGFPTFSVPHEMANDLAAVGYDGCTFASNHSLDRRPEGVGETLEILEAAGLQHSGAARSQAEFDAPTLYGAGGIAVASLSYTFSFNGFVESPETPWLVNEIDIDEIAAEATAARDAGADYVVLSVHWGTENLHEPNQFQLDTAAELVELDIDLIIGHHAHVVQPVAVVGEVPVVYGLGNFLSNQSANCCAAGSQDGVIMQVDLRELADGGFDTALSYVPTRVDRSDFTIVPVVDALASPEVSQLPTAELETSRQRTTDALFGLDYDQLTEAALR